MFASAVVCLAVRRCLRGQVTPRIAAALKQRCSPVGFAAHLSAVWIGHRTAEALGGMQPREISGLRTAAMTDRTAAQSLIAYFGYEVIYQKKERVKHDPEGPSEPTGAVG